MIRAKRKVTRFGGPNLDLSSVTPVDHGMTKSGISLKPKGTRRFTGEWCSAGKGVPVHISGVVRSEKWQIPARDRVGAGIGFGGC